jgi:ATP-dependent Clp protease protease subunit
MTERKIPTWLCGEFDESLLEGFIEFYNKAVATGATDAIIYIDSVGGYVHVCNSILAMIESSSIRFHTVVLGEACSCGLVLLGGGDVRYAAERSQLLFHDISFGAYGNPDQVEHNAARAKEFGKQLLTRFAKRTKKTYKWWMDKTKENPDRDYWFYAKEALELGVVDHIGIPRETMKTEMIVDVEKSKK